MGSPALSIVSSTPDTTPAQSTTQIPLSIVESRPDDTSALAHVSAFVKGLKTAPILHPIDTVGSIISMARHPIDTINSVWEGHEQSVGRAAKSFNTGDAIPGVIHAGLSLIPLIGPAIDQHYQEMKDAESKGDTVAEAEAAGKLMGIGASAELARKAPDIIGALPGAAKSVGDVAGAAKTGIKTGGPQVAGGAAMIGAGKAVSEIPGFEWPARLALEYPGLHMILKGVKQGTGAMLADLANRRAMAAAAKAAAERATQEADSAASDLASQFNTGREGQDTGGLTQEMRDAQARNQPPPETPSEPKPDGWSDQFSTGREDTGGVVSEIRDLQSQNAPVAAPPTLEQSVGAVNPPRVAGLQDVIDGQSGRLWKGTSWDKLSPREQSVALGIYEHLNAEPTDITPLESRFVPHVTQTTAPTTETAPAKQITTLNPPNTATTPTPVDTTTSTNNTALQPTSQTQIVNPTGRQYINELSSQQPDGGAFQVVDRQGNEVGKPFHSLNDAQKSIDDSGIANKTLTVRIPLQTAAEMEQQYGRESLLGYDIEGVGHVHAITPGEGSSFPTEQQNEIPNKPAPRLTAVEPLAADSDEADALSDIQKGTDTKTRSDYHNDLFGDARKAGLIKGTGNHADYDALKTESANITKNGKPMKSIRDLDIDEMKALLDHVRTKYKLNPPTDQ